MRNSLSFYLKSSQSPTHYNLNRYLQERGWCAKRFGWQAHFSDVNLQFDEQAAEWLEYKHLLAKLVAQYCPGVMPLTYCINDQNWPDVLNNMAHKFYLADGMLINQVNDLVWILKPALLNNGQGIKIFQQLNELEQHFLSSKRLGGEHVLQRYMMNPHLLRDQRKYSIRMFLVTTNYNGSYLYPHGYFNVARHSFSATKFLDLRAHLTNEHLHEEEANVIQIPSQQFIFFNALYDQIKAIITAVMKGLNQLYPQAFICNKTRNIAIYGIDFLVDDQGQVWLLEANHGPCFPLSDEHPLQKYLYYDFWQNFITSFVEPIALNQPYDSINYSLFEHLSA